MALLLEELQRERDVMRGQLRAVVKARLGPQQITIRELVGGNSHRARNQSVQAVRLVSRGLHQGCECQLHALGGIALQDVAVERIESEEVLVELPRRADLRKQAALRGVHVDVFEMLEVGRIFQVAERRDAVASRFRWRRAPNRTMRALASAPAPIISASRRVTVTRAILSWRRARHPTTRSSGTRTSRIRAASPAGRNGPSAPRVSYCR